jgi:hypothetical protein
MKATLIFDLPEDREEFETSSNAGKWKSVAWEMDQWLRGQTKHAPDDMSEDKYNTLLRCRKQLREIIEVENLNLD